MEPCEPFDQLSDSPGENCELENLEEIFMRMSPVTVFSESNISVSYDHQLLIFPQGFLLLVQEDLSPLLLSLLTRRIFLNTLQ